MARLSVPTTARLPPSLRVEAANAAVLKLLNRLSRSSLLSLVLDWLDPTNQAICPPLLHNREYPDDEDDDFYPPAQSLADLAGLYSDMQGRKGSKREVVDRIVEGDWRKGLTLYQLAMADLQYLYDHPGSLKWTAYKIERLKTPSSVEDAEGVEQIDKESLSVPRFHPSTFVQNLQAEVLPDVKAHYNSDRPKGMALWLLRIFLLDSPYNTGLAVSNRTGERAATSFDASRTIYIAFPDASPHIYISKSQSTGSTTIGESKSLRALIVDGIPKALSRPRERYTLRSTNLTTKNLTELLHVKGAGRRNAAGGGWSIYAEENRTDSPLNPSLPTPPLSDASPAEDPKPKVRKRAQVPAEAGREREAKRARTIAQGRFGNSAKLGDGRGIERVDIMIEDPFPVATVGDGRETEGQDDLAQRRLQTQRSGIHQELAEPRDMDDSDLDAEGEESWKPQVRLTLHGPHVFAGVRQLVEAGVVNGERMPGWMTGDEGVTIGAVKHGRIRGHKGSGL